MPDRGEILLHTKLHRPLIARGLIDRPQLRHQLDEGVSLPLTLVVASAGFGKTTLVCSWLENMAAGRPEAPVSFPAAWLSLDENDSDLGTFVQYFIAAVRTVFVDACENTLTLLKATQQPPLAALFATLSNELDQLPGSFILVLDDYHTIHSVEVHNLLNELARYWPKPLHLVLISRTNPPLPLSSLRAKGMISEIRTSDLRFSLAETASYLNTAQNISLSQPTLQLLEERFEGWIAGLHLAALSLRSVRSQESVLSAISSENANITGYLLDEVLTHLVPAIYSFLVKTSVLDRFCASLCEAVLGEMDAAWDVRACLDWIERSEMFITPLDDSRTWYRYHHLFQELLRQRASAEMKADQIAELHRLASAWFEAHGMLDEALHHALESGDLDLVARQINAGLRDQVNREDRMILERWLRLLPEEAIQKHPGLLMLRVWVLQFSWRHNLQAKVLQQVGEMLDSGGAASLSTEDVKILRGQILLIRSQHAYFSNQITEAIELCRQALALLPSTWTFARGGAMLYLGMSMQASGQALAAERLLLDEYESYSEKTDTYALLLLQSLCFIYTNSGQLERTRQIAQVLAQTATRSRLALKKNWGDYFLGLVCYQRNELQAAAQHFTQILENRFTAHISAYRDAVSVLASIYQIQGDGSTAWQMLESISLFDLEQKGSEDERTRSLRARILLMQGNNLEDAYRWADSLTGDPPDRPLSWLEEPQLMRVRVLMARASEADLRLATQILNALNEIAERTFNTRYKIEILALLALTLDLQGEPSTANAVLLQAVDLAHMGGFIRIFADLGKPMEKMLLRLVKQDHPAESIHRILAAFREKNDQSPGSQSRMPTPRYPLIGSSTLIEPLTPRELDVLVLLRERLSNKEIAHKLSISYATIKRHTINIYTKLGVNRRWDAVARAIDLGILPPD